MNEACHFLSMMKNTIDEENIFFYNLSAFLSAARSITFFMQKQYSNRRGFSAWYGVKQCDMDKDVDLKCLNRARVEMVHKKPIGYMKGISSTVCIELMVVDKKRVGHNGSENYNHNNHHKSESHVDGYYFLDDGKDIIIFSDEQLIKLEEIVNECEAHFP